MKNNKHCNIDVFIMYITPFLPILYGIQQKISLLFCHLMKKD